MGLRAEYKLFISHYFKENDEYKRLIELLDDNISIQYSCSSIPVSYKYRSLSKMQLEDQLRMQIKTAHCFLALDGVYLASPEWVEYELKVAGKLGIPIIGIKQMKIKEVSSIISGYAKAVVGWNIDSIVTVIKDCSI